MRLLTASYGAWRPELGTPVVASLVVPVKRIPESAEWARCWDITPRWSYWRSQWPDEFAEHYLAQLERYGTRRIAGYLSRIARERQAERLVLLCYEPIAAACHRSLFAAWWLHNVGEVITEVMQAGRAGAPTPVLPALTDWIGVGYE
jgi:hypothetical protein